MMDNIKVRILPGCNYKGIHFNGRTLRIALDPDKPVTTLTYPEFYDVKVTSKCNGECKYCYQNSLPQSKNIINIVDRFVNYFSRLDQNQKTTKTRD